MSARLVRLLVAFRGPAAFFLMVGGVVSLFGWAVAALFAGVLLVVESVT